MSRIREKQKTLILSAACQAFANKGYAGTKIIDIAALAGLPKANIYYYFENKVTLHRAVLESFIEPLLTATQPWDQYSHPAKAISDYIRVKIDISKHHPNASKVFANEILHGAPHLPQDIIDRLCTQTTDAKNSLQTWIDAGLMDDIDPTHLLFMLWASTQTYADFNWQVKLHLKTKTLSDTDFSTAADTLTRVILKGCGIAIPENSRDALSDEV